MPTYNVSLLIMSFEEMKEADRPDGVTLLDQVKAPYINTVSRANERAYSISLTLRKLFRNICALSVDN